MAINKTRVGTFAVDFRDQQRRRIQRTFRTHREAAAFEKEVRAQVQRQEYAKPSEKTVAEVAQEWHRRKVDAGTYRRSTLEAWKNHVDHFIVPELGTLRVHLVDVEMIEGVAAQWAGRVSPKTENKILTTLTAVFAIAKRYKLIKDNAAKEAEHLKVATENEDSNDVEPDQVYSKEEIRRLISATEPGSLERLVVMVPTLMGLRIGEVLGLTWPAVDLKAGKLHVWLNLADSDKGQDPILQPPKRKPADGPLTYRPSWAASSTCGNYAAREANGISSLLRKRAALSSEDRK